MKDLENKLHIMKGYNVFLETKNSDCPYFLRNGTLVQRFSGAFHSPSLFLFFIYNLVLEE
jgi:hypothetical protein